MRGARHKEFARAMVWIRSRIGLPIDGRPTFLLGLQYSCAQNLRHVKAVKSRTYKRRKARTCSNLFQNSNPHPADGSRNQCRKALPNRKCTFAAPVLLRGAGSWAALLPIRRPGYPEDLRTAASDHGVEPGRDAKNGEGRRACYL